MTDATWAGKFGDEYTARSPKNAAEMDAHHLRHFGITRTALNQEFLGDLPRNLSILEAGCGCGAQLALLHYLGFYDLFGLDINADAERVAERALGERSSMRGSACDMNAFRDGYFGLVMHSGLLIHLDAPDREKAMAEIYRVSRRYIFGLETYSPIWTEVPYPAEPRVMTKGDWPALYTSTFPGLTIVKQRLIPYLDNPGEADVMFLLEKGADVCPTT